MQWFTVIGLSLDIAGVSLITCEWYVSNYAPLRVLDWYRKRLVSNREIWLDVEKEMAAMLKYIPDEEPKKAEWKQRSKRDVAEAKERLQAAQKASDEIASRSLRSGVVLVAVSLLLVGFVLQLIGAWPA